MREQKKKEDTPSPSPSVDGSAQSTGEPSASATHSIGKSKEQLQKTLQLNNAEIIKSRMSDAFQANDNPVFKEKYIESLSKMGYDKKQLEGYSNLITQSKKDYDEARTELQKYNPPDIQSTENMNPQEKGMATAVNSLRTQQSKTGDIPADLTYKMGKAALALGKTDEAINMFSTTLGKVPKENQPQPFVQSDDARYQLKNVIPALNPANSLYGIGNAMAQKGDYKSSIDYYNEALKADPSSVEAQQGLAYSNYKLGNIEQSKTHSEQAQELKKQKAPSEALINQISEEAKGLYEQQRQSNEMKDIADMGEALLTGDKEGKLGMLGYLNPLGKWVSGIQEGAKTIGEGVKEISEGKVGTGVLTTIGGLANTAFAAMPEVTEFNAATEGIKESTKALPKWAQEAVSNLLDLPFNSVSVVAHSLGINPDDKSNGDKLLKLGDTIASFGTMAAIHGGVEKLKDVSLFKDVQTANDLKDAIAKAVEKGDVKDIEQIKKYEGYIKNLSVPDLKKVLEKDNSPQAKEVVDDINKSKESPDDLHTKAAELQKIISSPEFQAMPQEMQNQIVADHKDVVDNIVKQNIDNTHTHSDNADAEAKVGELQDKIKSMQSIADNTEGAAKESAQKVIGNLTEQLNSLLKVEPPSADVSQLQFSTPEKVTKATEVEGELKKEFPDVSFSIYEQPNEKLKLSTLFVKPELRNKGEGSNFLSKLKEIADRTGKKISVDATGELGGDIDKLNEFYPKNGFEKVGENKFEYNPKTTEKPIADTFQQMYQLEKKSIHEGGLTKEERVQFNDLIKSDPKVEEVHRNFDNIVKQLKEKGLVETKEVPCP